MLRSVILKKRLGKWMHSGSKKFEWYYEAKRNRIARLSEAQNHRCGYCLRQTWQYGENPQNWHRAKNQATLEHLTPRIENGHSHWFNTIMACQSCNTSRSSVFTPDIFYERMTHARHFYMIKR